MKLNRHEHLSHIAYNGGLDDFVKLKGRQYVYITNPRTYFRVKLHENTVFINFIIIGHQELII